MEIKCEGRLISAVERNSLEPEFAERVGETRAMCAVTVEQLDRQRQAAKIIQGVFGDPPKERFVGSRIRTSTESRHAPPPMPRQRAAWRGGHVCREQSVPSRHSENDEGSIRMPQTPQQCDPISGGQHDAKLVQSALDSHAVRAESGNKRFFELHCGVRIDVVNGRTERSVHLTGYGRAVNATEQWCFTLQCVLRASIVIS